VKGLTMRRTVGSCLAVAAALAVLPAAAATASHSALSATGHRLHLVAPATRFHTAESSNWFGYNQGALDHSRFTSVSGDWIVPTATQHTPGNDEASSDWIGIGGGCPDTGCGSGATDPTLIQAGTEQDVAANGSASYNAWWEIIPEPETAISMAVHPGDQIHVAIAETVPGVWSIQLNNVTTGQSFSTTTPYSGVGASAEWIEETPLLLGTNAGFSSLPNLTPVPVSHATVNGANANLDPSQEMDLIDGNGTVYSVPSAPNSTRDGFTACAWATTCS
jgi:hypothetical protein